MYLYRIFKLEFLYSDCIKKFSITFSIQEVVDLSKVANELKMLIILKSRGKMHIKELAKELEVVPRQISRYKDELEEAGIYIDTIPGKYGGYSLNTNNYLMALNVTDNEYYALMAVSEYLKYENFSKFNDFKMLADKICALKENKNCSKSEFYIKNIKSNCSYERERKLWIDFNSACILHRKMSIKYKSAKGEITQRVVRPYAVFQYKGAMYLAAYCEIRKSIRQFKLLRIQKYEVLGEKFKKDSNFDIHKYLKQSFGLFRDENEITFKLKIKYPLAQVIKEKIWVENQKIRELKNENAILFKANVSGITEIKSWILSMGDSVEVLSPQELRKEIVKDINNMLKIYK